MALPILSVPQSGVYGLSPYETQDRQVKALKIQRSYDPLTGKRSWYHLEFRQLIGFDSGLSAAALGSGVIVHTVSDNSPRHSYLLNMTSSAVAGMTVGQSFRDASAVVTIKVLSANSVGASINIEVAAPVP